MAAIASCAPSVRERTSIVARPRLRNIVVHPARPARIDEPADDRRGELRIFNSILPRHGVIAVTENSLLFRVGEVAVYDELWSSGRDPEQPLFDEGGIYVVEYQRPTSSMSWEAWNDVGSRYGRSRLDVSRSMVRIGRSRWPRSEDEWMIHPLRSQQAGVFLCSDGPFEDWNLADKVIGKVVGIYCPASLDGSAAA